MNDVLPLYRPRLVLEKRELELVDKHCVCIQDFLEMQAKQWLAQQGDEPALETFMSDGTPLTTRERHRVDWAKFNIRRAGRVCREHLVQRLWLMNVSGALCTLF